MSNAKEPSPTSVPDALVQAALQESESRGVPVADVPLLTIAERAGISRSTLMRRLGGTRRTLDEAVRAAGVDPGGHRPVRQRAIEAAGLLISEHGLAAATLERVAERAQCSVHSLYAALGGRDELLHAVYETYSPVLDVEELLAGPRKDLPQTVSALYHLLVDALTREPRVAPAMIADALSRPDDPAIQSLYGQFLPRLLNGVGRWLSDEIAAGRVRDLPLIPLMQQMVGPVIFHFLLRPVAEHVPDVELPTSEETIEVFTQTFLRAVEQPPTPHAEADVE